MEEGLVGDLTSLSVNKEISVVDALLLHAAADPEKNARMVQDQARYFLDGYGYNVASQNTGIDPNKVGLTTVIFTTLFDETMTPEQRETMQKLQNELREKSPVVKKLSDDFDELQKGVDQVTEDRIREEMTWVPDPLEKPFRLGNKIIELAAAKKVKELKSSFQQDPEKESFVVQVIPGKTAEVKGVFVSRTGKSYTPSSA